MWNHFDQKVKSLEQDFTSTTSKYITSEIINKNSYKVYRSDPFLTSKENNMCNRIIRQISQETTSNFTDNKYNSTFMTIVPENTPNNQKNSLRNEQIKFLQTQPLVFNTAKIEQPQFRVPSPSYTLVRSRIAIDNTKQQNFRQTKQLLVSGMFPIKSNLIQFYQLKPQFEYVNPRNYPSNSSKSDEAPIQPKSPFRYPYRTKK
uniref:Uncharacterized protein n=1 Tax=Spironucleus salmonicida TaxID=348837 RepID=V6LDK8_9EUKA|eukprot:EST42567.1 Hypothetical protein SS50377_17883 [Spironucleus salmonicida]